MLFRTLLVGSSVMGIALTAVLPVEAGQPKVVEVPNGPAFVQLPSKPEIEARSGQPLEQDSLLRTSKPGRMQVLLGDGRQFRMGGNALLRLKPTRVQLIKGSIIGWVKPGEQRGRPFVIRTRVATASIQGTTVFIELNDDEFKVFSWEGRVKVTTNEGDVFTLQSGQQLLLDLSKQLEIVKGRLDGLEAVLGESGGMFFPSDGYDDDMEDEDDEDDELDWQPPSRISDQDVQKRLRTSPLLNGFSTPLETMPEIEKELGVSSPPALR